MIDWCFLCRGVAAPSWPSTLMKCGTMQDVTGCATPAAEPQVRCSLCFTVWLFHIQTNPAQSFFLTCNSSPSLTRQMWRHRTSRRRPGRWCRSWRWPPPWRRRSPLWRCWTPGWAKVQPRGGRWSRPPGCLECRQNKSLCICCSTTTSGTSGSHLFGLGSSSSAQGNEWTVSKGLNMATFQL